MTVRAPSTPSTWGASQAAPLGELVGEEDGLVGKEDGLAVLLGATWQTGRLAHECVTSPHPMEPPTTPLTTEQPVIMESAQQQKVILRGEVRWFDITFLPHPT